MSDTEWGGAPTLVRRTIDGDGELTDLRSTEDGFRDDVTVSGRGKYGQVDRLDGCHPLGGDGSEETSFSDSIRN